MYRAKLERFEAVWQSAEKFKFDINYNIQQIVKSMDIVSFNSIMAQYEGQM